MTVAVVTGASRGIGRATAERLAARGLTVALLARSRADLEAVCADITNSGGRAVVYPCDLADEAAIEANMARVVRDLGAPRVLVNNAGIVDRTAIESLTLEAWDHILRVNLTAPFLVTRALLPSMRERGSGRIVFVGSISSTLGTARSSSYCASKWAVVGFMKSLAEELRGSGLQTLAVLPGSVDTEMLRGSGFPPQMTADDVAALLTYAALDAPDALHGSAVEAFG